MNNIFQLWPAIDLINGRPVRLLQGDYAQKTEYNRPIIDIIKAFEQFATGIHVVDLDGAKFGKQQNLETIKYILENSSIPIEVGGGIRSLKNVEKLFEIGISRVIIGSKAIEDSMFLEKCIEQFGPKKIIAGLDLKNGIAMTRGWQKSSGINLKKALETIQEIGIQTIIVTDIKTDGMLKGPNINLFQKITQKFPKLNIVASGGVGNIQDIKKLKKTDVQGVVFGKAFYENKIILSELQLN